MLKPSYKSLEGINHSLSTILILVYIGYSILIEKSVPSIDEIIKYAQSAQDISNIYNTNINSITEMFGLGKIGVLLFFLYKLNTDFSGKRSDLKAKELELLIKELKNNAKEQ